MAAGPFPAILGLHHATLLARDAAASRRFYSNLLGFRLVKRTVNYDDPFTYHLYFGDGAGTPGTVLTIFPYATMAAARRGSSEVSECALAVPNGTLADWARRLDAAGVASRREEIMGEGRLAFNDPDGTPLSLVESAHTELEFHPWMSGPVPPAMAICRLHSVTLALRDEDGTARVLTGRLGFRQAGTEGARRRFHVAEGGPGRTIDLVRAPELEPAIPGAGAVHHVALRTPSDEEQAAVHQEVSTAGIGVTDAVDRSYFRSIYFREPTGVLFEVATVGPGFAVDESADTLGEKLMLPQQLEPMRDDIIAKLPALD